MTKRVVPNHGPPLGGRSDSAAVAETDLRTTFLRQHGMLISLRSEAVGLIVTAAEPGG